MKEDKFEDDGRVVADMSGIERPRSFFDLFPRKPKSERKAESSENAPPIGKEERKAYTTAAVLAALTIAGIFAVGLGLVVLILCLIW